MQAIRLQLTSSLSVIITVNIVPFIHTISSCCRWWLLQDVKATMSLLDSMTNQTPQPHPFSFLAAYSQMVWDWESVKAWEDGNDNGDGNVVGYFLHVHFIITLATFWYNAITIFNIHVHTCSVFALKIRKICSSTIATIDICKHLLLENKHQAISGFPCLLCYSENTGSIKQYSRSLPLPFYFYMEACLTFLCIWWLYKLLSVSSQTLYRNM